MDRSLLAAGHGELIGALVVSGVKPRARRAAPGTRRTLSGEPGAPRPRSAINNCASDRSPPTLSARMLVLLAAWRRRSHDRRDLAALDDRMVRDAGLT